MFLRFCRQIYVDGPFHIRKYSFAQEPSTGLGQPLLLVLVCACVCVHAHWQ